MASGRLLRPFITIIALVFITVHLVWPQLVIDAVTLGLIVLALIPWIAPIIKSIDLPGVGTIEFRELIDLSAR